MTLASVIRVALVEPTGLWVEGGGAVMFDCGRAETCLACCSDWRGSMHDSFSGLGSVAGGTGWAG